MPSTPSVRRDAGRRRSSRESRTRASGRQGNLQFTETWY